MEGLPAAKLLGNRLWRLNNLYRILDKDGQDIRFQSNKAQRHFLKAVKHLNIILKARQLGFSTLIELFILDTCLFNSNVNAGVISDTRENAEELFETKIKYAWERLPAVLRSRLAAKADNRRQLKFANGSAIQVSTSFRGGTYQLLHVSELGKIAAKFPLKAKEIRTGAFQAVPSSGIIIVESTAEGRSGEFYDLVEIARKLADGNKPITPLDWQFFFYPWHFDERYRVTPEGTVIYPNLTTYFEELEHKHGIALDAQQRAWYAKKKATLGEDIFQEYPSTVAEAFQASIKGAYFATEMTKARQEGRLCSVPHEPSAAVDTWWDIGSNDATAIWFTQTIGREVHVIDYYENSGEGIGHYWEELQTRAKDKNYHYGRHVGPHDLGEYEYGPATTRVKTAQQLGLQFEIVPRVKDKQDSIQAARNFIPICWFDEEKCARGIDCLDNYRKRWSDVLGTYLKDPLHDEYSDGADAFQTLAMGYRLNQGKSSARPVQPRSAAGWT